MKVMQLLSCLALIYCFAGCKSSKTLDVDTTTMINVLEYGIVSDAHKDQTKAIQVLFDKYRSVGSFYFPKGTYLIESLDIYPGIHVIGDGQALFLKKPQSGKFSRMLNSSKYCFKTPYNAAKIVIRGINFDGNRQQQGPYSDYELEHQAMIFVTGNPEYAQRLNLEISNCNFRDGVADAISIWKNVNASIDSINVTDVFRGAITITGGHTVVKASSLVAGGDTHKTGVDIEVDSPGYGVSMATDVHFSDFVLDGDFDVSAKHGGKLLCERMKVLGPPLNIYGLEAVIEIRDSEIHTGHLHECKVMFPTDLKIINTDFYIAQPTAPESVAAALNIYWNTSYRKTRGSKVVVDGCNFYYKGVNNESTINGIFVNIDDKALENTLEVKNSSFKGDFDRNIALDRGGSVELDNVIFDGDVGLHLSSTAKYHYQASIGKISAKSKETTQVSYADDKANQLSLKQPVSSIKGRGGAGKTNVLKSY